MHSRRMRAPAEGYDAYHMQQDTHLHDKKLRRLAHLGILCLCLSFEVQSR